MQCILQMICPKAGSNRAPKNGETNRRCLCLWVPNIFLWFLWFYVSQHCYFVIPDGLQDFCRFWNFQTIDQIWTLRPPYLLQNYFKQYKNNMDTFYKRIFCKSGNLKRITSNTDVNTISKSTITKYILFFGG